MTMKTPITDKAEADFANIMRHNQTLIDALVSIQEEVEELSCGGIGADGATQEELDAANEEHHFMENDSTFHTGQQIWLLAERAINLNP